MNEFLNFEFGADVMKGHIDEKTGKMVVIACASDDRADLQRDIMTQSALTKMVSGANRSVPLLPTHRDTFEIGKTTKGYIVEKKDDAGRPVSQMWVELELNGDYPQSRALFREVTSGTCKRQLSIGGRLNLKNKDAISVEMQGSGMVRKIHDLELDHIACTREKQAANPRTGFIEAVMKSLVDGGAFKAAEEALMKADGAGNVTIVEGASVNTNQTGGKSVEKESVGTESDVEVGVGFFGRIGRLLKRHNNSGGEQMDKINKTEAPVEEATSTTSSKKEDKVVSDALKKVEEAVNAPATAPAADAAPASAAPKEESTTSTADDKKIEEAAKALVRQILNKKEETTTTGASTALPEAPKVDAAAAPVAAVPAVEACMGKSKEDAATTSTSKKDGKGAEDAASEPSADEEEMLREIAILLSKVRKEECASSDSKSDEDKEETMAEKEAIKGALWNIRYLLAKEISEAPAAKADSATAVASAVAAYGPFAPRSGAKPAGFVPDKVDAGNAVAPTAVSDARNLPPAGGEVKPTAPTAEASFAATASSVQAAGKLPQVADVSSFGKELGEEYLTKSVQASEQLVLKAVEEIMKAQSGQFGALTEALGKINSRLSAVESVGGVSQSGPRGTAEVAKSGSKTIWGGILGGASKNALKKM